MATPEHSTSPAEPIETCVCVPVRDEGEHLPRLLRALLAQTGVAAARWAACFLLDRCRDDSRRLIEAFAVDAPFVVCIEAQEGAPDPNAGGARRAAMAMGLRLLTHPDAGILLTTDADSAPAPDWIASARRALLRADVAAGLVVRTEGAGDRLQGRLERYYDGLYALRRRLDPLPWEGESGHHFTGGANMGFRARAYADLGGFRELAAGEDAHLIDEASRAGLRVRRDRSMVVETSSRRDGRATGGLAASLRALDAEGEARISVAHPEDAAWQYARQAVARGVFDDVRHPTAAARLSALIDLPHDHLVGVAAECANGEAFANRIVPCRPGGPRLVSLAEAEHALHALTRPSEVEAT